MLTNPGGRIAAAEVVGRDSLITSFWNSLERQSLRISAERRIGKTTVLNKMEAEPKAGWRVSQRDLERCHSAREFAGVVHQQVHGFLAPYARKLTGSQPLASAGPWKSLLEESIADLYAPGDKAKFLFLWDEVPYMLQNIQKAEGPAVMGELLDTLRALHNSYPDLRVVFTGSIGLHHVLPGTTTVNHMLAVEVPPLTTEDAALLARKLLIGSGILAADLLELSNTTASEADNFPFYIHHIVRALKSQPQPITAAVVRRVVADHLVQADDPWELRHYEERISDYYGANSEVVRTILDILVLTATAMSVSDLLDQLKRRIPFDDRRKLLSILVAMSQDHYLKQQENGAYHIRFPLIGRWWKLSQGL